MITTLFTTSWESCLTLERELEQKQTVHKYIQTIWAASTSRPTTMDTEEIQETTRSVIQETNRSRYFFLRFVEGWQDGKLLDKGTGKTWIGDAYS